MVGTIVKYQMPRGPIVDAFVLHEFGANDMQAGVPDAEGHPLPVDPAELEKARSGRRQVNLLHLSPDPADTHAFGRTSCVAVSVPHQDHYDAALDVKHGFWFEGGR